jgi:hypothetical protein
MAIPEDATFMKTLLDKLDGLKEQQAELEKKLDVHVATETAWQDATKKTLDEHIEEHKAWTSIWRKGAIGVVFMLAGTLITWIGSFVWAHRGP